MCATQAITSATLLASKHASLITRPIRTDSKPSMADTFFFVELSSSLGYDEAHEWLKTTNTSRARSSPLVSEASTRSSSPCSDRRSSITSEHQQSPKAGQCEEPITERTLSGLMEIMIQEHGSRAGLLFTDSAHRLLDSPPTSPGRDCDLQRRS